MVSNVKKGEINHLHAERSVLDFRCAFAYDEGDAVGAVFSCLCEVDAEQVELPLELLVAALDGEGFQTLLMAGQRTLRAHVRVQIQHSSDRKA